MYADSRASRTDAGLAHVLRGQVRGDLQHYYRFAGLSFSYKIAFTRGRWSAAASCSNPFASRIACDWVRK